MKDTAAGVAGTSERTAGRMARHVAAAVLLAMYWWLAVSGVYHKSITSDEAFHLPAGYSYWAFNDYRLQPENGNLPQRWAAIPLAASPPRFPATTDPIWKNANVGAVGDQMLYRLGNDARHLAQQGRAMIALAGVGLGLLVYLWSRRLFGPSGGLLSVALYALSPTMLAHGSLITSDVVFTLFYLLASVCLWWVLRRMTLLSVAASCVVTGLLFISKASAILIVPVGLILLGVRLASSQPLPVGWTASRARPVASRWGRLLAIVPVIALHILAAMVIVWGAYGFRFSAFNVPVAGEGQFFPAGWPWILDVELGLPGRMIVWARDHRLLPEAFLYGYAHTLLFALKRGSFAWGEYGIYGWWWFFPFAVLIKTPLPVFATLAASAWAWHRRTRVAVLDGLHSRSSPYRLPGDDVARPPTNTWRQAIAQGLFDAAPLWVSMLVLWAMAIPSHLNIGVRHVLPTYPVMFVLAGGAAWWWRREHRVRAAGVALLVLWMAAESFLIRPHYLAYFNQLVGGPRQGYRYLSDSNLDWGQDLPGLKRWLDEQGLQNQTHTRVYLSYFGTASIEYHGVRAELLPCFAPRWEPRWPPPLTGGVYCVSATMLQVTRVVAPGPWTVDDEAKYQQIREQLRIFEALRKDAPARLDEVLAQRPAEYWARMCFEFEGLRFARLCARLKEREPDDQVGYSILIYRLSDEFVRDAIEGPAPANMVARSDARL